MQVFRNMIEADITHIAALEADTFSDAWTAKSVYDTSCQKHAFITVAEVDGKFAGYCIIYFSLDEGEIARIAVAENFRRRGVGRRLLDYTCDCCRERKVGRLLLDVRMSNESAGAFYRQYGFAKDGIRKNFYEKPQEDAILMSKSL